MDINTIVSLVASLGFPVAMCLCLCWYIVKRMDATNQAIMDMLTTVNKSLAQNEAVSRHNVEVLEKVLEKLNDI